MSLENLKEYAQRCANEPELRETAKTIGMTDLEGQMRYAESLGLEWTMEDMAALRKEATDSEDGLEELSEEELEQIGRRCIYGHSRRCRIRCGSCWRGRRRRSGGGRNRCGRRGMVRLFGGPPTGAVRKAWRHHPLVRYSAFRDRRSSTRRSQADIRSLSRVEGCVGCDRSCIGSAYLHRLQNGGCGSSSLPWRRHARNDIVRFPICDEPVPADVRSGSFRLHIQRQESAAGTALHSPFGRIGAGGVTARRSPA